MPVGQHGQPINESFNRTRRVERDIAELLGIAKGMLADGKVTEEEANYLQNWVEQHPDAANEFPLTTIRERLERIFADGRVDEGERTDLFELLTSIVGGNAGVIVSEDASCDLPCDEPPPVFKWSESLFVFTGKFAFGPREKCESEVLSRGGTCASSITKKTNYLVIGSFGSRDWIQTSYGRKIEKAVEYRANGCPLAIVAEYHWIESLK